MQTLRTRSLAAQQRARRAPKGRRCPGQSSCCRTPATCCTGRRRCASSFTFTLTQSPWVNSQLCCSALKNALFALRVMPPGMHHVSCKTTACLQVGEHGYGELAGSGMGFAVVELNAASVRAWRLVQVWCSACICAQISSSGPCVHSMLPEAPASDLWCHSCVAAIVQPTGNAHCTQSPGQKCRCCR